MECQCKEAGYCPIFKRQIVGRLWDICNDRVLTKDQTNKYKELWVKQAAQRPEPQQQQQETKEETDSGCACQKSNVKPRLY